MSTSKQLSLQKLVWGCDRLPEWARCRPALMVKTIDRHPKMSDWSLAHSRPILARGSTSASAELCNLIVRQFSECIGRPDAPTEGKMQGRVDQTLQDDNCVVIEANRSSSWFSLTCIGKRLWSTQGNRTNETNSAANSAPQEHEANWSAQLFALPAQGLQRNTLNSSHSTKIFRATNQNSRHHGQKSCSNN